jgi:prefoldin subunit 4
MKRLEHDQGSVDSEVSRLAGNAEKCEKEMKDLKVVLYAKFGRAINLDE